MNAMNARDGDSGAPHSGPLVHQSAVRMRGPADMAEMLPYLLGFFPDDSIVALGLQPPGLRQGGTVRVDIPHRPHWQRAAEETARLLVRLSEHRDRRPAAVVLYLCRDPQPGQDGRAVAEQLRPLADHLAAASRAQGLEVMESLCVSAGRWWSYLCAQPDCCDPAGTPLRSPDQAGPVAAAATFAGLSVRGSRKQLGAALQPVGPPAAEAQRQAFERVVPEYAEALGRAGGMDQVREQSGDLLETALECFRAGADRLDDEQTARLLLGLQDKLTRDRAAEFAEPDDLAAAQRLWRFLAQRCVPPYRNHAAAPLTLLAWTSWLAEDTATARVALSCALDVDPSYTLAQLLYDSLNGGIRPDRLLQSLRRERVRRRAGRGDGGSRQRTVRTGDTGTARPRRRTPGPGSGGSPSGDRPPEDGRPGG